MRRTIVISFVAAFFFIAMFYACAGINAEKQIDFKKPYSRELAKFIPDKPHEWKYSGFSEYMHDMKIENVFDSGNVKNIKIKGAVADLSDGASDRNFAIDLEYTITADEIIQEKSENLMMDSEFDKISLVRMPIIVGNNWSETLNKKSGGSVTMTAKITRVETAETGRVVTVEYKDSASDYYEKRKIKEGMGVVYFEKLLKLEGESFPVSYSLLEVNSKKVNPLNYEVEAADSDDGENNNEDIVFNEVKATIIDFDNAWVDYVNYSSRRIFTLVEDGSSAYAAVSGFDGGGYRQRFDEIDVRKVSASKDGEAEAIVYERIARAVGGIDEKLEYTWRYSLRKKDGKWLIYRYAQYKQ